MWFKWAIRLDTGAYSSGGSSYCSMGHALDAALWAALQKNSDVIRINIHPAT